ncbi:MerR family transcriptional regulator [Erysipelothrix sp. HDW6C]|uniref:MerR family transcriptional regulator n=1 Tax=Erysipelothrix sp. HDW6C TaxID=2714930 RepID=UPI00140D1280|nr:MerR family transcriptional regulator [Erysipelothrix sp. HDW6C]QIK69468.1 MerR family transcriptional regulator [Erysipelothrix sp. HDW6C]
MSEHYFLINEVAKLHNMSKKTLIYYDRIGIFKPDHIDEETGYRYYLREQFPYLKQIMYLKKLDFSLDEIQELLENRQFAPLIDKLSTRLVEVDTEITHLHEMKQDLEYLIDFYQQVQFIDDRDLFKPGIKLFNTRTVIYELCDDQNDKQQVMLAYRKMLRTLISLNIFSQMPYGTIHLAPEESGQDYYQKVGSFISLPHSMGLPNEIEQPRGKYAYMYKKGGYYDESSLNKLLKWIKDNGYTPVGNVYDFSLIDYTFTKSESDMIQEIQIRIE